MSLLLNLTIVAFALFPAFVLTTFLVSHFRKRLGWRLIVRACSLGVISGMLVISISGILYGITSGFAFGVPHATARAFIGAAIPEELAKFLLLYYIVREHKDADSGGDLFCAAMLISLGFAGLENVFYLLASGDRWFSLGTMRSFLAIMGHAAFGCLMGYFAARAFRGFRPYLNWPLALIIPVLAHGLYDMPLMVWEEIGAIPTSNPKELWLNYYWMLVATLTVMGGVSLIFSRRELVEIFQAEGQDPDLRLPERWEVRPWRWLGNLMIVSSSLAMALGGWLISEDVPAGTYLLAPSILPHFFGWIMRLRPPAISPVRNLVAVG